MKADQLKNVLDDIGNAKVAVIGDFCLDIYWFINESASEVSIETGEPTRPVSEQKYSLGGAGNVANNLIAMGVKDVRAFGVIGNDPFGSEMVRIMELTGIDTRNLIVQEESWHTHSYAKPYTGEKELSRIDFGNFNILNRETANRLISNLEGELPGIDMIIINQQVPSGIHTTSFRSDLLEIIRRFPDKKFIVDSRNFNDFYHCAIHKMNDREALKLSGKEKGKDDLVTRKEVIDSAGRLFTKFGQPLFITRGDRGSVVIDKSGIVEIPSVRITGKVDTVGAGDSYLAGAASALAAGYDMKTAAETGTLVAAVTVQKLFQTGTATPEEILHTGLDPDFIFNPDLAENLRDAIYLEGSEIEIIKKWPVKQMIKYAIFDHDGTISTLREGWEKIMAPMMKKAILGLEFSEADESLYSRVHERVAGYIDATTGIQTISQMQGLIGLIREFGIIPEKEILSAPEYKKIYNEELLMIVNERVKKLSRNELMSEDFMIKNVNHFMKLLFDMGITLYLASGTDTGDLRNEASVLGYDKYFEDRIFGSVGDIMKDAKKMVLDKILDTIGESESGSVITFGDGPVEIRETKKRGGITVGVASDELRRFGLNESKRLRLIKAGADIIIPDFTQSGQLLRLLNLI